MSKNVVSKFKTYSAYKDSGVEWLGGIPEHWITIKFGYLFKESNDRGNGFENLLAATQHRGVIFKSDLEFRSVQAQKGLENFKIVRPNDFVISLRTFEGGIEHSPFLGIISPAYTILRPKKYIHPIFFKWYMKSDFLIEMLKAVSNGIRDGKTISYNNFSTLSCAIPPLTEQQHIAQFLDQETSRIDTLITKKERLIELLKEKRTALISHAVTKGLNPDVPMKDSGVEWLGAIPESWKVSKLKNVFSLLRDGTHQPPPRVAVGIPLLSVRNIVNGKFINLDDDSLVSEEDFKALERSLKIKTHDVLLAIVGATLGKVAIVENMPPFTIQRSLAVLRPNPNRLSYKFLHFFLESERFQNLLWMNVGFSAQPGIYLGALGNFCITLPSLEEQQAIAQFLDQQTNKIDTLITKTKTSIEKLKEYRTALISAAVTGKIDVRETNSNL